MSDNDDLYDDIERITTKEDIKELLLNAEIHYDDSNSLTEMKQKLLKWMTDQGENCYTDTNYEVNEKIVRSSYPSRASTSASTPSNYNSNNNNNNPEENDSTSPPSSLLSFKNNKNTSSSFGPSFSPSIGITDVASIIVDNMNDPFKVFDLRQNSLLRDTSDPFRELIIQSKELNILLEKIKQSQPDFVRLYADTIGQGMLTPALFTTAERAAYGQGVSYSKSSSKSIGTLLNAQKKLIQTLTALFRARQEKALLLLRQNGNSSKQVQFQQIHKQIQQSLMEFLKNEMDKLDMMNNVYSSIKNELATHE